MVANAPAMVVAPSTDAWGWLEVELDGPLVVEDVAGWLVVVVATVVLPSTVGVVEAEDPSEQSGESAGSAGLVAHGATVVVVVVIVVVVGATVVGAAVSHGSDPPLRAEISMFWDCPRP